LFTRRADAAGQYVPLRISVVKRDGAIGFVEGGIQLAKVQQRSAQEHTDIGPVRIEGQILSIKADGFGRPERSVSGVGRRQQPILSVLRCHQPRR
jgi:hypothetical protein